MHHFVVDLKLIPTVKQLYFNKFFLIYSAHISIELFN